MEGVPFQNAALGTSATRYCEAPGRQRRLHAGPHAGGEKRPLVADELQGLPAERRYGRPRRHPFLPDADAGRVGRGNRRRTSARLLGMPGFQGMGLDPAGGPHMSFTAAGYANGGSYYFHFPDGNASIARLLLRSLIPEAVDRRSVEDIVTAKVDYSRLDRKDGLVRIRLNSPVVRARHKGDPSSAREVEIAYVTGKGVRTVTARACVLACWMTVAPYLCPELPARQKQAMHYLVKVPLVYSRVGIRNWSSFA